MKLVHPDIQFQIEFKENRIPVCIVESPICWRKLQKELFVQYRGGDGRWVLSHDDREIKISKSVEMILNPLQLEENQKRIMTGFLQSLGKRAANENYWKKGQELNTEIQKFFGELEVEYSFGYHINPEIDFVALAKAMGIRIDSEFESDLERLLQYCLLTKEIFNPQLFIFWNLHHYYTKQELQLFYQEIMVRKWKILLMETSVGDRLSEEKYYIIDRDFCEIY